MTPWAARVRRYWSSPSRSRAAGHSGRRAGRPATAPEADAHRPVGRSLPQTGLAARMEALAADPPLAAGAVEAETDVGVMLLHTHDEVITPQLRDAGTWEPSEGAWLRSVIRPGDTVVDCGANVGYFSLLAARATGPAGSVVAVEPEAANLRLLRANLWRNRADGVWVVPVAAADGRGTLALRRNVANSGDHQVHAAADGDEVLVPSLALDELLGGLPVDVVKIDTQGVDHLVIAGLRSTIAENPGASLLIEFWLEGMTSRSTSPRDVLRGYRDLGRPIALLGEDGVARPASDDTILAAAAASAGQWVNLVMGAAA